MAKPLSQGHTQEWKERLQLQRDSVFPVVTWCWENKVSLYAFYYWKHKLSIHPLNRVFFKEQTFSKRTFLPLEY